MTQRDELIETQRQLDAMKKKCDLLDLRLRVTHKEGLWQHCPGCNRESLVDYVAGSGREDATYWASCAECGYRISRLKPDARLVEMEGALQNLLARIHRDGGHYTEEHGLVQSAADAETIWSERIQRLDVLEQALRNLVCTLAAARDSVPTGLPWIYDPCRQNNPDCPSSSCQVGYALAHADAILNRSNT